ncbi:GNAT family N-acetyltransferase [Microbulbifer sp. OS29]|uniref:GNAT family N-acetyltransferase n=1 Tax=Microbulbifer okhotskensis TaxID=2926617 RepID=A0A9X2EP80_9GAMM|nr:GNAT family N-acetyltransferase [Microbulbifer okhotskensis]MCO1335899.1 GNAT family N-acetyltransferase [Microbulbifer okhotskensis]
MCDAAALSAFYVHNTDHLRPWEPAREAEFHSVDAWHRRIGSGESLQFMTVDPKSGQVLALYSLTNIIRGPLQACNMGYAVDWVQEGRGLMRPLCTHAVDYAFTTLKLSRVMANYMPSNERSDALLAALGFSVEGKAKKYLEINGCWEDHVLTAKVNPRSA